MFDNRGMSLPPKVIKISVSADAKKVIRDFAVKHDMKEIGVASRIYTWFAQQDDVIRKGILGMLPEGYEPDIARLMARRLTKRRGRKG